MNPFSITCTTCTKRLRVTSPEAIGQILACPKCGSMVLVQPPPGWSPDGPPSAADSGVGLSASGRSKVPAGGRAAGVAAAAADFEDAARWVDEASSPPVSNPGSSANLAPIGKSPTPRIAESAPPKAPQPEPVSQAAAPPTDVSVDASPADIPASPSPRVSASSVSAPVSDVPGSLDGSASLAESASVAASVTPPPVVGASETTAASVPAPPPLPDAQWLSPAQQMLRAWMPLVAAGAGGLLLAVGAVAVIIATRSNPELPPPVAQTDVGENVGTPGGSSDPRNTGEVVDPGATTDGGTISRPVDPTSPDPGTVVNNPPIAPPIDPTSPIIPIDPPTDPVSDLPPDLRPTPSPDGGGDSTATPPDSSLADSLLRGSPDDPLGRFLPYVDGGTTSPDSVDPSDSGAVDTGDITPDVRTDRTPLPRPQPVDVDVESRLADPVQEIELSGAPLVDVLSLLTEMSTIPITLPPEALLNVGAQADAPVTVHLMGANVEKVLAAVLAERKLTFSDEGGQLVVRPGSGDVERRTIRYDLSDLGGAQEKTLQSLADLIRQLVRPDSWDTTGGTATLATEGSALTIHHDPEAHFEILVLCEKLRLARGLPKRSRYPDAVLTLVPRWQQAASRLSSPVTLNYHVPARLTSILRRLREETGTMLLVDWESLARENWPPHSEASMVASGQPLGEALTAMLDPMDLAWRVADGATVQILSARTLAERNELEFYKVDDLAGADPAKFVDRIVQRIGPRHFTEGGGQGVIVYDAPSRHLLVSLPQPLQRRVGELLDEFRAVR